MKILAWQRLFQRRHSDRASPFADVLPRVRTIREHCDWQSSTTPASREQRRERVLRARQKIVYRPVPYDRVPDSVPVPGGMRRLWLAGPLVVLCAAVGWALLTADRSERHVSRGFSYQLPGAPPFLAEQLALAKAQEALSQVVRDPTVWTPIETRDRKGGTAPDGTRDVYLIRDTPTNPSAGLILFDSTVHTNTVWAVDVQLQANRLWCTVSRAR